MVVQYQTRQVGLRNQRNEFQCGWIQTRGWDGAPERLARPIQATRRVEQLAAAIAEIPGTLWGRRDGLEDVIGSGVTVQFVVHEPESAVFAVVQLWDRERAAQIDAKTFTEMRHLRERNSRKRIISGVPDRGVIVIVK